MCNHKWPCINLQVKRIRSPAGQHAGSSIINLFINDILNVSTDAHFIILANDRSLFLLGDDSLMLERNGNRGISEVGTCSKVGSLEIDGNKTTAVLFLRNKCVARYLSLQLRSQKIE